jgi:hypothetical protein
MTERRKPLEKSLLMWAGRAAVRLQKATEDYAAAKKDRLPLTEPGNRRSREVGHLNQIGLQLRALYGWTGKAGSDEPTEHGLGRRRE